MLARRWCVYIWFMPSSQRSETFLSFRLTWQAKWHHMYICWWLNRKRKNILHHSFIYDVDYDYIDPKSTKFLVGLLWWQKLSWNVRYDEPKMMENEKSDFWTLKQQLKLFSFFFLQNSDHCSTALRKLILGAKRDFVKCHQGKLSSNWVDWIKPSRFFFVYIILIWRKLSILNINIKRSKLSMIFFDVYAWAEHNDNVAKKWKSC